MDNSRLRMEMPDNIRERFTAISERLKVGGAEVGRKVSERVNIVGGRMKELFQAPTQAGKLVEEATAEKLRAPDWGKFMEICDMLNDQRISGQEVVRAIKKRIMSKNAGVQLLALTLLETCVKNYEKMFSEMASERLLDEMVKMAEDPQTWPRCREKALILIEAWGESTEELRYLPVYEETYKSMRARGVRFPGRDSSSLAPIFTPPRTVAKEDNSLSRAVAANAGARNGINMESLSARETLDVARNSVEVLSTVLASSPGQKVIKDELTISLAQQCRQVQLKVQRIAQRAGEDDALLFEALTVNDELQQVLTKFEEISVSFSSQQSKAAEPAVVTAHIVEDDGSMHRPSKPSAHPSHSSPAYDPLSDLEDEEDGHLMKH